MSRPVSEVKRTVDPPSPPRATWKWTHRWGVQLGDDTEHSISKVVRPNGEIYVTIRVGNKSIEMRHEVWPAFQVAMRDALDWVPDE
jgi:hypothetical protein